MQPTKGEANLARLRRLREAAHAYDVCDCLWPLVVMRNGDGHDPECPAHIDFGSRHNR